MNGDLGPLPKTHEREAPTNHARQELSLFLLDWRQKYSLTSAEYVLLLSCELHLFGTVLVAHERRGEEE